jgi:hypothetical protein
MAAKMDIGRLVPLDQVLDKIEKFLDDNNLETSQVELAVEYPPYWEIDGPDVVLREVPRVENVPDPQPESEP